MKVPHKRVARIFSMLVRVIQHNPATMQYNSFSKNHAWKNEEKQIYWIRNTIVNFGHIHRAKKAVRGRHPCCWEANFGRPPPNTRKPYPAPKKNRSDLGCQPEFLQILALVLGFFRTAKIQKKITGELIKFWVRCQQWNGNGRRCSWGESTSHSHWVSRWISQKEGRWVAFLMRGDYWWWRCEPRKRGHFSAIGALCHVGLCWNNNCSGLC